jgi:hypothetical protein
MNKRLVGMISAGLLALSLVGCSNNNDAEVKALQEQVAKLEQQINDTEKEANKPKEDVAKKSNESEKKESVTNKEKDVKEPEPFTKEELSVKEPVKLCADCGYALPEMIKWNGKWYCGCQYHEEIYICDICGQMGTCNLTECYNYEPEPVEEDIEANWEICYDCGEYFPPEYMTFNGRSYHCGCVNKSVCPECNNQLNEYGICTNCRFN